MVDKRNNDNHNTSAPSHCILSSTRLRPLLGTSCQVSIRPSSPTFCHRLHCNGVVLHWRTGTRVRGAAGNVGTHKKGVYVRPTTRNWVWSWGQGVRDWGRRRGRRLGVSWWTLEVLRRDGGGKVCREGEESLSHSVSNRVRYTEDKLKNSTLMIYYLSPTTPPSLKLLRLRSNNVYYSSRYYCYYWKITYGWSNPVRDSVYEMWVAQESKRLRPSFHTTNNRGETPDPLTPISPFIERVPVCRSTTLLVLILGPDL